MLISRLTSKGRTTIPQPVRTALNLRGDDELHYGLQGNQVVLTKARQAQEAFVVFDEWDGEADRKACAKLRILPPRSGRVVEPKARPGGGRQATSR